jgi:hypothetical protein
MTRGAFAAAPMEPINGARVTPQRISFEGRNLCLCDQLVFECLAALHAATSRLQMNLCSVWEDGTNLVKLPF